MIFPCEISFCYKNYILAIFTDYKRPLKVVKEHLAAYFGFKITYFIKKIQTFTQNGHPLLRVYIPYIKIHAS